MKYDVSRRLCFDCCAVTIHVMAAKLITGPMRVIPLIVRMNIYPGVPITW